MFIVRIIILLMYTHRAWQFLFFLIHGVLRVQTNATLILESLRSVCVCVCVCPARNTNSRFCQFLLYTTIQSNVFQSTKQFPTQKLLSWNPNLIPNIGASTFESPQNGAQKLPRPRSDAPRPNARSKRSHSRRSRREKLPKSAGGTGRAGAILRQVRAGDSKAKLKKGVFSQPKGRRGELRAWQ